MIPVFEPEIGEEEINAVVAALRKGEISGTFGDSIPSFEKKFAAYHECEFGVAVSSGTTALHLAVAVAGIQPGDEVLVSASTNIATALAVYHNNAVPVPVDSEAITWNLDLDLIESLISPKTKAIIPVHLFGHPVDMRRLCEIAEEHNLIVIEDCAEAHGATAHGRKTGGFGDMSCYSFYANKIITTGEGGMLITNNPEFAEKAKLLRNLAFMTPRFLHDEPGYNFRMTGYQAAMGLAQLNKIDTILENKRRIANTYNTCLDGLEEIQLPVELDWAYNVYWMYAIVVKSQSGNLRDDLMRYLKDNGVDTRTFFCPMNQQPFLKKQKGYREVPCPVADDIWENGLYLPSSYSLSDEDIKFVSSLLSDFFGQN